jgi:uncharacterized protein YxjI
MKLFIEKRPFRWDDEYDISYEDGSKAYHVKAQTVKKRLFEIVLCNRNDMEIGKIVRKKGVFGGSKFTILFDGNEIGTITKDFTFAVTRWVLTMSGWRIFGMIPSWEYDILDENTIVMHAGTDGTKYNDCGKFMLDVYYDNNESNALLVALGMEAANSLIKTKKRRR